MIKTRIEVVLPILLLSGCASMSPTDKGVLGGAAVGAGTGALIGRALGNTGAGAAIGGIVGGFTGGAVGNEIERSEARATARAAAQADARSQIGMADVINMAQSHVNDSVIITEIRTSPTVFHLTPNDVIYLKQQGVSDAVVQEMLATARRRPSVTYQQPAYGPYWGPPPPPVGVGVGFGYSRW